MFTIRFAKSTWAHHLSPVGDIKYSWGENGCLAASWGMALPAGFFHPALIQGAAVEIFFAGCRVWYGVLEEPDRDEWKVTAAGFSEFFKNVAVLSWDLDFNPELGGASAYDAARYAIGSSVHDVPEYPAGMVRAFDFAVDYTIPGSGLVADPSGDPPGELLTMRDRLDDYTKITGKRWMVDENGLLWVPPAPTTPTFALTPNVPGVGLSLENYYSTTFLKYLDHYETSGLDKIPIYNTVWAVSPDAWRWGPRERVVVHDLEQQITEAFAQEIVDALQDEATAAPTEPVELADGQLVTLGGTRVPLPMLKTNVMVRHFGVLDEPGARNVHEWVINHFEYDTETGKATIAPRHIAPRTLAQVVQSISGAPAGGTFTYDSDAA